MQKTVFWDNEIIPACMKHRSWLTVFLVLCWLKNSVFKIQWFKISCVSPSGYPGRCAPVVLLMWDFAILILDLLFSRRRRGRKAGKRKDNIVAAWTNPSSVMWSLASLGKCPRFFVMGVHFCRNPQAFLYAVLYSYQFPVSYRRRYRE